MGKKNKTPQKTSKKRAIKKANQDKADVLIVGDWFVDEHWPVGVHRSPTSSRTGQGHYRAIQGIDDEIRAFCGAGRSAFFLRHVNYTDSKKKQEKSDNHLFNMLYGLGFWHQDDNDYLKTLFDPNFKPHSPFRLQDKTSTKQKSDEDNPKSNTDITNLVKLINLNDGFEQPVKQFTTRIIRIYRRDKDESILFDRFDFEPQPVAFDWNKIKFNNDCFFELGLGENKGKKTINDKNMVIMVKDLLKGAVDKKIISQLVKEFPRARWYVSTKQWMPSWIDELKKVDLRLFFVPQVAAKQAIQKEGELSCWLTSENRPSFEALKELDSLKNTFTEEGKNTSPLIVVMPERPENELSLIARAPHPEGNGASCIILNQDGDKSSQVAMGIQSIFFPSLCASMETIFSQSSAIDHQRKVLPFSLNHALISTSDWVKAERERILNPRGWNPDPNNWKQKPSQLNLSEFEEAVNDYDKNQYPFWRSELANWNSATNIHTHGIITIGAKKQLQLWRSSVEIEGYVCLDSYKRRSLKKLVQGLRYFSKKPQYHTAGMLVAKPGSGKTFLIEKLAAITNLEPILFNITHLSSRAELTKWFDAIQATQSSNPNKKHLVFIDEINAEIDNGGKLYSSFLSPLEDGTYVREGQLMTLSPCAWIFAGTVEPKEDGYKGSDFESRLTLGTVTLNRDQYAPDENKTRQILDLEQIYVGANLLRRIYPDVRYVSKYVLEAFRALPQNIQIRDIKHFVRNFHDIQYGCVTSANVPKFWPNDLNGKINETWYNAIPKSEEADIEIVMD